MWAILALTVAAAAFPSAFPPGTGDEAVVSADVKGIDEEIVRLRVAVSEGLVPEALRALDGIEKNWSSLQNGLAARGLEGAQSVVAFSQTLSNMRGPIERGPLFAAKPAKLLAEQFAQVKTDLRSTIAFEPPRLIVPAALAAAGAGLAIAVRRVGPRMGAKPRGGWTHGP